jgi:hypothetical protein
MSNLGAFRGAKARRASIDAAPRRGADRLASPTTINDATGTARSSGAVTGTSVPVSKSSTATAGAMTRPGRSLSSPKSPGNFRRGLDWAVSPEGVISGTHASGVHLTVDDARRGMRDRDRRRDGPPMSSSKDKTDRPPSNRNAGTRGEEGAAALPNAASRAGTSGRKPVAAAGTVTRAGGIPKGSDRRGKRAGEAAGGSPAANLTDVERSLVQAHMAAVEAAVRGALSSPPPLPSLPSSEVANKYIRSKTPDKPSSTNRNPASSRHATQGGEEYSSDSDSTSAEETAKRRPTSPTTRPTHASEPLSTLNKPSSSGKRSVPDVMSPPPSRRPPSPPNEAAAPIFAVDRVDVIERLRGELEAAYEVITLLGGNVEEPNNGEKEALSSPLDADKRVLQLSQRVASLESSLANTQMLCDGEISRLVAQHTRELAIEKERQTYLTRTAEEEMEAVRASHQQKMHEMEKQIARAVDVSMGFQEELQVVQATLADMSEQRTKLQQELETARLQRGVPSPSSLTSAAAHIQAIEEAQALRARVQELEKTVVQRNEAISHLRNEAAEKQLALLRDVEAGKRQLEQQAAQFRAEMAAAETSKGHETALHSTRAELEASRAHVAELELACVQQKMSIAVLHNELTQFQDAADSNKTTQQNAVREAEVSAAHWQKMFEESQAVNKEMQRRVKDLEHQVAVSVESGADQNELRRRLHDAEAEVTAVRRIAQLSTNQSDHLRAQLHQVQQVRDSSPLVSAHVISLRMAVQHASAAALRQVAAARASTTALKWVVSTEMGAMAELFGEAALSCGQLNHTLSVARSPAKSPRQPSHELNIIQQQQAQHQQQQIHVIGEQLAASQRHIRNLLNTIDGIVTTLMKASPAPIPPALASIRSRIGQPDASGLLNDVCSLLQSVMTSVNAHHSAGIAAELSRLTAWKDSHIASHRRLEIALEGKNKDIESLQRRVEELQKQLVTRDWQPATTKKSPPKAVTVPVVSVSPPSKLESSGMASFTSIAAASRSSPHRSPPVTAPQSTPLSMTDLTFAPATVPQVISKTEGSWRIAQGSQMMEKTLTAVPPTTAAAPVVIMSTPRKEAGGKQDILSKASDVLQHARSVMREAGTPGLKSRTPASLAASHVAHAPLMISKTSPTSNVLALRARLAKLLMHDTRAANMDLAFLQQMAIEQQALQQEQLATYHQITNMQASQPAVQPATPLLQQAPPPSSSLSSASNSSPPTPPQQPIIHQAHRVVLVAQPLPSAPVIPAAPVQAPTSPKPPAVSVRPPLSSKPSPAAPSADKPVATATVTPTEPVNAPQQPSVRPPAAPPKPRKSASTPAGTDTLTQDTPVSAPATPVTSAASLAPRPPVPSSPGSSKEVTAVTPTPPARPSPPQATKATPPAAVPLPTAAPVTARPPVPPSRQTSSNKSVRFSPPVSSAPPIMAEVEDTESPSRTRSVPSNSTTVYVQPAPAPASAPARAVVTLAQSGADSAFPPVRTLSSGSSVSVRSLSASSTKPAPDVDSHAPPVAATTVPSSKGALPPRPTAKPNVNTAPPVKRQGKGNSMQPSSDSVAARHREYFRKLSSKNGDTPASLTLISPAASPALTPLVSHGSLPSIDSAFDDDIVVLQSTSTPAAPVRHPSNRQASLSMETAPPALMHGYEEEFGVDMQHEREDDDERTREGEEGDEEYYNQDMHPAVPHGEGVAGFQGDGGGDGGDVDGEYWHDGGPEEGETYDNGYQWYPHGPAPEGYGYTEDDMEEGHPSYDAYAYHDNNMAGSGGMVEYGYYNTGEGIEGYDTEEQVQSGSWVRAPRQGQVPDAAPRRAAPAPSQRQAAISRRLGLSQFYTSAGAAPEHAAPATIPPHFPDPAASRSTAPAVFQGPRRGKVASLQDLRSQRRLKTGQSDPAPAPIDGRDRPTSIGTPDMRGSEGGGSEFDIPEVVRVGTEETIASTLDSGAPPGQRPRFVTDTSISAPDLTADAWEGAAAPHARNGPALLSGEEGQIGKPKRAAARSLTRKGASTRSILLRGQ